FRHRAFWTGAVTGLPGGLWALVAAGADVQLTAVYAVRMAADIAQSYGYDTSIVDEQAHLAEVLALAAGIDSLRGVGNWLTREGLMHILPEVLPKILTRISVKLSEEQAAKLIGRLVPGVGAAIGGTIDYTFLRVAGERAIAYYHTRYMVDHGLATPDTLPPAPPDNPAFARRIVDGSLAQPQQLGVPASEYVPVPAGPEIARAKAAAAQAGQPALPAAKPGKAVKPSKKHRSAPERIAIYIAIFAICAFAITIAACAALGFLVYSVVK
ncbi:MAG: EcsC family protein, partial [Candidatus Saccharimonadales bacterium]